MMSSHLSFSIVRNLECATKCRTRKLKGKLKGQGEVEATDELTTIRRATLEAVRVVLTPSGPFNSFILAQRDEAITSSAISEKQLQSRDIRYACVVETKLGTTGLASKAERKWICFVCFCTGF
jgi:hypothetical protein